MAKARVDINLGQLSAQFLPLSELFAGAAESFIIMGSWCAKGEAWLLSDRAVNAMDLGKITTSSPVFYIS